MNYSESSCFSASPAKRLNEKAFKLNKSLFMFAYYEPKPYCEKESGRSKFTTAICNLYGLFWDCGPFVFELLNTYDSILIKDWIPVQNRANSLRKCISAYRSIFCHNNSARLPLNAQNFEDAENWAAAKAVYWEDEDIVKVTDEQWGVLLKKLIVDANSFISDLNSAIDTLLCTTDFVRRDSAIERWIQRIAVQYQRKEDYLLNAMANFYLYYLRTSNTPNCGGNTLRNNTRKWVCDTFGITDSQKYLKRWLDATIQDSGDNGIGNTKIYSILKNWPKEWATFNGSVPDECEEAPMPASDFFKILANDVYRFAQNPYSYVFSMQESS